MVALDKCCFCIPLQTGCLIIGYLNIVAYSLGMLGSIVLLVYGPIMIAQADKHRDEEMSEVFVALGSSLTIVGVVLLILCALFMAIAIVFVVGVHKEKRGHVKVFLIFVIINLVLSCLGAIGSFKTLEPQAISSSLISIGCQIYVLLVVKSYYDTMNLPQTPPVVYHMVHQQPQKV